MHEHRSLFGEAAVSDADGRTLGGFRSEWRLQVRKPDNHWDCLVGCAVWASMLGARGPGEGAAAAGRRRKRHAQEHLNGGRR